MEIRSELGDNSYVIEYNTAVLSDKNDKRKKVFGYCRVSFVSKKDKEKEIETINAQIKSIKSNIKYKKDEVVLVAIYVDEGISGKNIEGRPGLLGLLEKINANALKHEGLLSIYTCYIHRLSRNVDDFMMLCKNLSLISVELNAFDYPLNIKDKNTHSVLYVVASQAEATRQSTITNTKNCMRELSEAGELVLKHKYGWVRVYDEKLKKNIQIKDEREQKCIAKVIEIWENNNRDIAPLEISNQMNELPEFYYKEKDREWNFGRVKRLLYEKTLSERDITNTIPINKKDEVCRLEIIKMINDGITMKANIIARKLDDLCLFKHRITSDYVKKLLNEMGDLYNNQLEKNIEDHVEKVRSVISQNKNKTYAQISQILNEEGITTLKGNLWSGSNINMFCLKHNIKK
jgi:DNA invertase Pin-like site-specific DNA recombinase